ncbi:Uncharacterized protein ChrSV_0258 [Chromobacterium vaccinii]|nr:Uncharacterized protein ChrSW_0258 [Chromobacterium vaccinii]QND87717.1 Uncharacterized protein ChrSV_0258 [Chromobacterium vaccinii]
MLLLVDKYVYPFIFNGLILSKTCCQLCSQLGEQLWITLAVSADSWLSTVVDPVLQTGLCTTFFASSLAYLSGFSLTQL